MSALIRLTLTCLSAFLLCAPAIPLWAQETSAQSDPDLAALDARVRDFLEGVSGGEVEAAYDDLVEGSRLALPDRAKAREDLIDKTKQLEEKYGTYRGFEPIASKRVGEDLVLLRYLYKCEDFPVVWYFAFYRTSDSTTGGSGSWRLVSVRFSTELQMLWY